MSRLQDEIRQLKHQRATELRNVHFQFSRTKRDLRRSLSPDRYIRRHLGLFMGGAAILAMLLAPAPRYRERPESAAETPPSPPRRKPRRGLVATLNRLVPQLKKWFPALEQAEAAEHEGAKSGHSKLVTSLLALLGTQIDFKGLLHQLLGRVAAAGQPSQNGHAPAPESPPTVIVADGGTQRADEPLGPLEPEM